VAVAGTALSEGAFVLGSAAVLLSRNDAPRRQRRERRPDSVPIFDVVALAVPSVVVVASPARTASAH